MGTFRAFTTPEDAPSRGPWCDNIRGIDRINQQAISAAWRWAPGSAGLGLVDVVAETTAAFGNIGAGSGASPYQGVGQTHIGIH
jgi:hypothetical protein